MSKRTWDTGVVEVIKRERNQAIALNSGRKCRKQHSGRFSGGPALQPLGVPLKDGELVPFFKYIRFSII
jgi:hypothetical protein